MVTVLRADVFNSKLALQPAIAKIRQNFETLLL